MAWNIYNIKAKIVGKSYDKTNEEWIRYEKEVDLRPIPSINYEDSVDGNIDNGKFSFVALSDKPLTQVGGNGSKEIEVLDLLEFEFAGVKYNHLITHIETALHSNLPDADTNEYYKKYTIYSAELTLILTGFRATASFPRAVKGQIAPREVKNLSEVVGRLRLRAYFQKTGGNLFVDQDGNRVDANDAIVNSLQTRRGFLTIWDRIDAKLMTRLTEYKNVPTLAYTHEDLYSAFKDIFSLIHAIPYIYMNDRNQYVLSAKWFEAQEVDSGIETNKIVMDNTIKSNQGYGTKGQTLTNNITSKDTIQEEIIHFSVDSGGKWAETDAYLQLRSKLAKVIKFEALQTNNVWADLSMFCKPKELAESLPKSLSSSNTHTTAPGATNQEKLEYWATFADYNCYYGIGTQEVKGFGDKWSDYNYYKSQNCTWYLMFKAYNELMGGRLNLDKLESIIIRITYQVYNTEEIITTHKDNIDHINKFSVMGISTPYARTADYNLSAINLKQQLNRSCNPVRELTVKYINGETPKIAPLLSKYDNLYITRRIFNITPNMVEITYELTDEFTHITNIVGVSVSPRGTAFDLDNATTCHITYDEFMIWDKKQYLLQEQIAPASLTEIGQQYYFPYASGQSNVSITDGVFVAPNVVQTILTDGGETKYDTGLLLGVQTSSGLGYNQVRMEMLNNIFATWEVRNQVQQGVPYTEDGGYLNKIGLSFGAGIIDKSIAKFTNKDYYLSRLPYITWSLKGKADGGTDESEELRQIYENSVMISMGNINPVPDEELEEIDDWSIASERISTVVSNQDWWMDKYDNSARKNGTTDTTNKSAYITTTIYTEKGVSIGTKIDISSVFGNKPKDKLYRNAKLKISGLNYNGVLGIMYDFDSSLGAFDDRRRTVRHIVAGSSLGGENDIRDASLYNLIPRGSSSFYETFNQDDPEGNYPNITKGYHDIYGYKTDMEDEVPTLLIKDAYFGNDASGNTQVSLDSIDLSQWKHIAISKPEYYASFISGIVQGTGSNINTISNWIRPTFNGTLLGDACTLNFTIDYETNNPKLSAGFGATSEFDLAKASNEKLIFGYNLHSLSHNENFIIGEGLSMFSPLFTENRPTSIRAYLYDEKFNKYRVNDISPSNFIGSYSYSALFKRLTLNRSARPNAKAIVLIAEYQSSYYDVFTNRDEQETLYTPICIYNFGATDGNEVSLFHTASAERPGISLNANPYDTSK